MQIASIGLEALKLTQQDYLDTLLILGKNILVNYMAGV